MNALTDMQAGALVAVAKSIDEYADSILCDPYCDMRQYERDSHLQEHLRGLASHMRDGAAETLCDGS